jgi:hypothetical protein
MTSPGRGWGTAAVAVALCGVVAGAAGCTSGSSSSPTSAVVTSPVALPPAFPGLTAPELIVKMKAAVGRGAVVTYAGKSSVGNPPGRGSYVVSRADRNEAPGSYLIQTNVDNDKVVYSVVCTSQQKASGLTPILKLCTDLAVTGLDNASLRAWVGAKLPHTSTIHRQFGPVTVALTFSQSELDIVLDYGGKP